MSGEAYYLASSLWISGTDGDSGRPHTQTPTLASSYHQRTPKDTSGISLFLSILPSNLPPVKGAYRTTAMFVCAPYNYRKAKALDGMSRFEEAFHTMQRGVKVEPDNVVSYLKSTSVG
jgi:hypothetical protein